MLVIIIIIIIIIIILLLLLLLLRYTLLAYHITFLGLVTVAFIYFTLAYVALQICL